MWLPALIGAAGSLLGGYVNRRDAREYMQRNSLTGRIEEGRKHGINKLVSIGAQGSPYVAGRWVLAYQPLLVPYRMLLRTDVRLLERLRLSSINPRKPL